jgi:alpha-L-fucosidase
MKRENTCLLIVLLLCFSILQAQPAGADLPPKATKTRMADFMSMRFGMFIHWGPVTLRGTEIGWSRNKEVPADEYDELYKEFDPVLFDAAAWVHAAKEAGMKYLTITAKHHDGFCLWPTAYSDYNIMHTPFKKDVVGELARECKKQGIIFCIYFTVLDWHNPDYPIHNPHHPVIDSTASMDRFVTTMKNELNELITRYHPYMLWFDGNWESPWKHRYAVDVNNFLRRIDPQLIINNRLEANNDHEHLTGEAIGDYATPEQKIGELNMNMPWETCMTICNQWAWKPNDDMKSLKDCIQTLVKTAAGNGNLLFNVGPMMDGRMEARQTERLKLVGEWLKKYGESIYGTMGGPYRPNETFATTRKDNKIFLHVFNGKTGVIVLPPLSSQKINKVYFLHGAGLVYEQDARGGITIHLPDELPDKICQPIVLELDGNAADIPVIAENK